MGSPDFLHKHAETPLCEHYLAAGALCSFSTNSELLLNAASRSFLTANGEPNSPEFSIRIWVDESDLARPPWPKPYVRGLDHIAFAGFDDKSSLLADLSTRTVIGRFSAGMAADEQYWARVIFPMLVSIVAGSVGLVELHASCVARGQDGLILIGPSRSGKSTLAKALTDIGFRLLSDDRTFCSLKQDSLFAYGLPRPLKLRRDAGTWFEEFRGREPGDVQNGESVYFCHSTQPAEQLNEPCRPSAIVLLDRVEHADFRMTPMESCELRNQIETDLLREFREAARKQETTIEYLLSLPSWRLQYGEGPQSTAAQIRSFFFPISD
jgi:hypothetical protein